MPAQANQTYPTAGTVFNDGVLTLTLPGGAGVIIGLCSEFSFEFSNSYKSLPGPGTYYPAAEAVAMKSAKLTIKTGVVDLRPIMAALGASAAYVNPTSTLTELMGGIPPLCGLTWKTPSDGTDIIFSAPKVAIDNLKMAGVLHEFNVADWSGHCLPDPASTPTPNSVFTIKVTGNQTAS